MISGFHHKAIIASSEKSIEFYERLTQLQILMEAAYDGKEDRSVVPAYYPAGEHGCEDKGKAFAEQMRVINGYAEDEPVEAVV